MYYWFMEKTPMTYGQLKTMRFGWVMAHVVDDMCANEKYESGNKWMSQKVSEYDIRTIREKAVHFGEALPGAFVESVSAQTMQHATEYLIEDLKALSASYEHGNDCAKPEIDNVSEAINILDRLRGTTEVAA
jgi:hypothetical protein